MAHPKSRISKQRKRKRRTHYKIEAPNVMTCSTTGQPSLRHRAHWHEGKLYYRGRVLINNEEAVEVEDDPLLLPLRPPWCNSLDDCLLKDWFCCIVVTPIVVSVGGRNLDDLGC
jgi:large subunit ribosomal protein L32